MLRAASTKVDVTLRLSCSLEDTVIAMPELGGGVLANCLMKIICHFNGRIAESSLLPVERISRGQSGAPNASLSDSSS